MTEHDQWSNPLIPNRASLHHKMDQTYEELRAEHDRLCKEAIDKRFKAQSAAIELLSDARVKPYVPLMAHLSQSTSSKNEGE